MSFLYHYASHLPKKLFAPLSPSPVPNPTLLALNTSLAQELDLDTDWLRSPDGLALLTYGKRPDGNPPIAMAYAGHQFGHFVPSLGDGRAMLVGEIALKDGTLRDLHLKGSGPTPFSRGGDGLCALGPALREYLVSETMHALGIPSSRALALLTTGKNIERDNRIVPSAIVARTARSHIRIGTFQYAAVHGNLSDLRTLANVTLARLFPKINPTHPQCYHFMLQQLIQQQAVLIAQWMSVGFIHGVMNTDNFTLSGETLDYGPCAFLDTYNPHQTFSFIDQNGRYAYNQQPHMAFWNLCRLAECLLPLFDSNDNEAIIDLQNVLKNFNGYFHHIWLTIFRRKLGLFTPQNGDMLLLNHLFTVMRQSHADFTQFFRLLSSEDVVLHGRHQHLHDTLRSHHKQMDLFLFELSQRLTHETHTPTERYYLMQASNPHIIPRNHQIERVIKAAENGHIEPFRNLRAALRTPFSSSHDEFAHPPHSTERIQHTFCGT